MNQGGLYEAKVVSYSGNDTLVLIPQVFLDTEVLLFDYVGDRPEISARGYVSFISGDIAWPVWVGQTNL